MTKQSYKRRTVSDAAIEAALRWSSSRAEAARRLNVHRSTLQRWLRDFDPARAAEQARRSRLRQYVELQTALENDPDVQQAWRPVAAYLRAIGAARMSDMLGDPRVYETHKGDAGFVEVWKAFRAVEDRAVARIAPSA